MKRNIYIIYSLIIISITTKSQDHPKSYICYQTKDSIIIDGNINELSWEKASWADPFIDIEGEKKAKPYLETKVKMIWNSKYLYIAAELEENHIWANLKQRDTVIFYDNDFEVFIDPDGDNHEYYELEINAFGTEWDLFLQRPYRDIVKPNTDWDIKGLRSAIKVFGTINNPSDKDEKWTVEIAIPWGSLRGSAFPNRIPMQGEQWRMNFSRVQWITDVVDNRYVKKRDPNTKKVLPEQNWVWSPQGKINMHMPEMWGYVQFSQKYVGESSDVFNPDPDWNIKMMLMQVYYLQKEFFKLNDKYAANEGELDIKPSTDLIIEVNDKQFVAYLKNPDGKKIYINNESKIWHE